MSNGSSKLNYDESQLFAEKIKQIQKRDPHTFKRTKKVVDRLLTSPESYDHLLHGNKSGKLIKYVGRNLARIVYNWCENCRKSNCMEINNCVDCENKPDNTLRLFDVFYKNQAAKLGY